VDNQKNASSSFGRALRRVHRAIFVASRHGRAAEIAAWSNAAASAVVAAALSASLWSRIGSHAAWLGLVVFAATFAFLRLSLAHRTTIWLAAFAGTTTVAGAGGGVAWVFAHVIEASAAPLIAAIAGALLAGAPAAWAYAHLAKRRAHCVPDSLLEPLSAPPSH